MSVWSRLRPHLAYAAWTLAVGVLTDLGENYRSRLLVDPLVVALVAVAVHRLVVAVRASVPRRNAEVLA